MIVLSARGVVWVHWLGIRNIGTVDLQSNLTVNESEVAWVVSREILDWVVVVHLLDGGTGLGGTLGLGDHHVLWERRQSSAFIGIQVDVLRVDFIVSDNWGIPRDTQFHVMVLERNQWDRGLPVFTERKSEWVERPRRASAGTGGLGITLSHRNWGDVLREVGGLFIDDLTTNQKLHLFDSIDPIGRCECLWGATRDVAVTEEVTLAFETNGRDTTRGWSPLEHLALHGLGKVRVTTIVRSEEADFGLTDEMGILGTDGDELGNTTRHFIYIEVIFLTGSSLHDG